MSIGSDFKESSVRLDSCGASLVKMASVRLVIFVSSNIWIDGGKYWIMCCAGKLMFLILSSFRSFGRSSIKGLSFCAPISSRAVG